MEAQLVKREDRYDLYDSDGHKIASTLDGAGNKLSLKNCQAIELGYDLDELAENFWKEEFMKSGLIDTNSYKKGFQKCLELMGDKKFSEEDMKYFAGFAIGYTKNGIQPDTESVLDNKLKSLQQTEWEVEIEMEPMNLDEIREQGKGFLNANTNKPKLDADGCLILKRV